MVAAAPRRTLVASHYQTTQMIFNTGAYELAKVVAACEGAAVLAPPAPQGRRALELDRLSAFVSRELGYGNRPHAAPTQLSEEYDLLFYTASWLRDVAELRRVRGWRDRCKTAVAFIFECWLTQEKDNKPHYKELEAFDHVIVCSQELVEPISARIGPKVSFLPYAVDTDVLTPPLHNPPPRLIDVYAMGRQPKAQHQQLLQQADRPDFFYHFDTFAGAVAVTDFPGHAAQRGRILQRTKILPCYGPTAFENRKASESAGQQMTPLRFYEAAASGAVVMGEPPPSEDYQANFDWQDAFFPATGTGDDYAGIVRAILADPARMAAASRRGIVQALQRHDWAHRWKAILEILRLPLAPAHEARLQRLAHTAQSFEA